MKKLSLKILIVGVLTITPCFAAPYKISEEKEAYAYAQKHNLPVVYLYDSGSRSSGGG